MDDSRRQELISTLFKLRGTEFSRCFAPGPLCDQPAIRAHSVQNARCLDLLSRDGHVIGLSHRLDLEKGLIVQFSHVGRNRATTFAGLCARHDNDLFAPIDTEPLDLSDPQHLFSLAYRAVIYELHATCAAGWLLQTGYLKRVELGLDPNNEPSPAGLYATQRMIIAYETYQYKAFLDHAYWSRDHNALQHDVVVLTGQLPAVAASALFDIDGQVNSRGEAVRVCLTILPLDPSKTGVVLSYLPEDSPIARAHLERILTTAGALQKYELSRILLNYCSNFVISPDHFDTWGSEKRAIIRDYFASTILRGNLDYQSADLLVF